MCLLRRTRPSLRWRRRCSRGLMVREGRAQRAIACKGRRHAWQFWQSWQSGICILRRSKGGAGFESHPLRHPTAKAPDGGVNLRSPRDVGAPTLSAILRRRLRMAGLTSEVRRTQEIPPSPSNISVSFSDGWAAAAFRVRPASLLRRVRLPTRVGTRRASLRLSRGERVVRRQRYHT